MIVSKFSTMRDKRQIETNAAMKVKLYAPLTALIRCFCLRMPTFSSDSF